MKTQFGVVLVERTLTLSVRGSIVVVIGGKKIVMANSPRIVSIANVSGVQGRPVDITVHPLVAERIVHPIPQPKKRHKQPAAESMTKKVGGSNLRPCPVA